MTQNVRKAGLVLEGGGMRGVFTAGVLDFFLEEDIQFDTCIGVSAGSCLACSYLSKQYRRGYRTVTGYLDDPRYCGMGSFFKTGDYFGAEMLYKTIPDELDPYDHKAFLDNPTKFYAVVTNCETGQAEYKRIRDLRREICYTRASSSLPLMSRTLWIRKKPYLDGGITDSIPIRRSESLGNEKNVVILTRGRECRKQKNQMMPLMRLRYGRQFPKLVERMENRHLDYNETLDHLYREEKEGKVFLIQPPAPVEIGRLEKDGKKLEALYCQGYETAKRQAEALKKYLEDESVSSQEKTNIDILNYVTETESFL